MAGAASGDVSVATPSGYVVVVLADCHPPRDVLLSVAPRASVTVQRLDACFLLREARVLRGDHHVLCDNLRLELGYAAFQVQRRT